MLSIGTDMHDEDAALYEAESESSVAYAGVERCSFGAHLGDRIQWFRAREEVECWRERLETIQAYFLNGLRGFRQMQKFWSVETADLNSAPVSIPYPHTTWSMGHAAYARRQGKMYEQLYSTLKATYDQHPFQKVAEGEILADLVGRQREESRKELDATVAEHLKRAAQFTAKINSKAFPI